MERHYATYLLAGLLILLFLAVAGYLVLNSRALGRERQKQRDTQVERERRAEQRMAENGGRAISDRAVSFNGSSVPSDPSVQAPAALYPDGHRRPGTSAGTRGWR